MIILTFALLILESGCLEAPLDVKLESCDLRNAVISWTIPEDKSITKYVIQSKSDYSEDWQNIAEVPSYENSYQANIRPYSEYEFRLSSIDAENIVSEYTNPTDKCVTPSDVPDYHPEDVSGAGETPDSMNIKWKPMIREEYNGPGLFYKVNYRPLHTEEWETAEVSDPEESSYTVNDLKPYSPYEIKVEAVNEVGSAKEPANIVVGYSGEDVPDDPPENLELLEVIDGNTARISWSPVDPRNVNGPITGYKIESWTTNEDEENKREMIVSPRSNQAVIDILKPFAKNMVQILVKNVKYDGPPSSQLLIETPEGIPGPPHELLASALGSTSARIIWKPPKEPNGRILGYKLQYFKSDKEGNPLSTTKNLPPVTNPNQNEAFLNYLEPKSSYKVNVQPYSSVGYGDPSDVIVTTTDTGSPETPDFSVEVVNDFMNITKTEAEKPGAFFYVTYKQKGDSKWRSTPMEMIKMWTTVKDLEEEKPYELQMISINDNYSSVSDIKEFAIPLDRPPNVPESLAIQNCTAQETRISWDEDTEKVDVTHFIVENIVNDTEWKELDSGLAGDKREFSVSDLPEGTHKFRVTSVNDFGHGYPSAESPVCEIIYPEGYEPSSAITHFSSLTLTILFSSSLSLLMMLHL